MNNLLDKKDKLILWELEQDARQSNLAIAKKIGVSPQVVDYRIKLLESKGVISGYYSLINFSKLGYMYCRLFIRLRKATNEIQESVFKSLSEIKNIAWVSQNHGAWDIALAILVENIVGFEATIKKIIYKHNKHIEDKEISIACRFFNFKSKFLLNETNTLNENFSISGNDNLVETLTTEDIQLLNLLNFDARKSLVKLGKMTNQNISSIRLRIRKLVQKNIIQEFRPAINFQLLGLYHYHVFLYLEDLTKDSENSIIKFLKSNPYVIFVTQAIGRSDMEFDILLPSDLMFTNFMEAFKTKYAQVFRTYAFMIIHRIKEFSYLPKLASTKA